VSRASDGMIKRASARYFYRLFNLMSPLQIPFDAGDYRLMDRRVVDELKKLHERNRFMKGLMAWAGFRTTHIDYARPARSADTLTAATSPVAITAPCGASPPLAAIPP